MWIAGLVMWHTRAKQPTIHCAGVTYAKGIAKFNGVHIF